jgi:diacylglycerol kinase family enzyme
VAVCNLGIGFDGEVAQVVTKSNWKKRLGKLAYALGVIRTVFRFKKTKIRIRIDDEWFQFPYAWLVAVCNLPTYGGGMRICPNAKVDDGKIDLACVSGISSWKLISLFPRVYRGSHATHSAVTLFSGRRVQIEADRKLLIHADGEIVGTTPIEISILPASLTILG